MPVKPGKFAECKCHLTKANLPLANVICAKRKFISVYTLNMSDTASMRSVDLESLSEQESETDSDDNLESEEGSESDSESENEASPIKVSPDENITKPYPYMQNKEMMEKMESIKVKETKATGSDLSEFLERVKEEADKHKRGEVFDLKKRKELASKTKELIKEQNDFKEVEQIFPNLRTDTEQYYGPKTYDVYQYETLKGQGIRPTTAVNIQRQRVINNIPILYDKTNRYPIPVKYIRNFPCYSRAQLNDLNHLLVRNILSPWIGSEVKAIITDRNVIGFTGNPPWLIWEDVIEGAIKSLQSFDRQSEALYGLQPTQREALYGLQPTQREALYEDFNIPTTYTPVQAIEYLRKFKNIPSGLSNYYIIKQYNKGNTPFQIREGVSQRKTELINREISIQFVRFKQDVWEWDIRKETSNPSHIKKWNDEITRALGSIQTTMLVAKLNSQAYIKKRDEWTSYLETLRNQLIPIGELEPFKKQYTKPLRAKDVYNDLTNKIIQWNGGVYTKRIHDLISKYVTVMDDAKEMINYPHKYFKNYRRNMLRLANYEKEGMLPFIEVPDNTIYITSILKNMGMYEHVLQGKTVTITLCDVVEYIGDSHFQFHVYMHGIYETSNGKIMYLNNGCIYSESQPKYEIEFPVMYVIGPNLNNTEISTKGARRLALLLNIDISKIPPCFSAKPNEKSERVGSSITVEDVMMYFERDGKYYYQGELPPESLGGKKYLKREERKAIEEHKQLVDKYKRALHLILKNQVVNTTDLNKTILSRLVSAMNEYETKEERKLFIETITVPAYYNNLKQLQLKQIKDRFNQLFQHCNLTFDKYIDPRYTSARIINIQPKRKDSPQGLVPAVAPRKSVNPPPIPKHLQGKGGPVSIQEVESILAKGRRRSSPKPKLYGDAPRRSPLEVEKHKPDRPVAVQTTTGKACNPKSPKANDPLYICNKLTGRWILKR